MYERDDSASRALAIITDRIRALPEYEQARELVVRNAVARIQEHGGASVAVLRSLGGLTQVVRDGIAALPAEYDTNRGSPMYPRSVRDMLGAVVGDMREEVQATLASPGVVEIAYRVPGKSGFKRQVFRRATQEQAQAAAERGVDRLVAKHGSDIEVRWAQ